MIQPIGIDSSMLFGTAREMGDILKYANEKNNDFIENMINVSQQENRLPVSEPGLGENINSYA